MAGGRGSVVGAIAAFGLLVACPGKHGETITEGSTSEATTATSSAPTTGGTATTGGATTTSGGEPTRCVSLCESDRDCLQNGADLGFGCVAGQCVPACASDEECVADLSGWSEPCVDQGGCGADQACIDVDGAGRCALVPGVFACADFGLVELMRSTIAGDMTVTVCGQGNVSCTGGQCVAPCASDTECPAAMGHPFCDVNTGQCECEVDQDCVDSQLAGYTRCIDGRCGCSSDADCAGGKNVDTCHDGVCGCSSDAACTDPVFDGAPLKCQ
jgi:hypothetical protein